MIKLCSSSVITVAEDGSTRVFEPEEIQAKLVRSFIAAGIRESWLAEDIALSVEYSLGELASSKVFSSLEIDSFVIKVLHEIGLKEVAEHYGNMESKSLKTVPASLDRISEVISRFLGLEGEDLYQTAEKVMKACSTLGLKEAFPSLILELSKHYHHEHFKAVTKYIPVGPGRLTEGIWSVPVNEILEHLPAATSEMVAGRILFFSGISKLFPSVRIDINLVNFARKHAIEPPVTELAIIPWFDELATAVNSIVGAAEDLYNNKSGNHQKLPLYLKFTDAILFATEWLGGEWPETASCLKDMATNLTDMIGREVIVRNLPV